MKMKRKEVKALLLCILLILTASFAGGIFKFKEAEAAKEYPYLIKVNRKQSCVTVYEKDSKGKYTVPVKAMICSAGWETPLGTFKTPAKYRWRLLMDDVWGQYSTRIKGGILFHSVWYYQKDPSTLSERQYNKLGTVCSHGCVRLTVEDAKWIYDNCPLGTTVVIYDSNDPGPLGKPQAIKLQNNWGWDPTDITNSKNPYNDKKPVISGAKNKSVKYNSKVSLKQGVTAKSTTGTNITASIKVTGSVNTSKPGKYKVKYSVKDLLGRSATKTVTYTVLADTTVPVIKGVSDKTIGKSTKVNREYALKNISVVQNGKSIDKKNIVVNITKTAAGNYKIKYTATGTNGRKAVKSCFITVDSKAPVFSGIADREIAWDTQVNKALALEGVTVSDNITKLKKSDISVKILDNKDYSYTVVYTASDNFGNKAEEAVTFLITDFLRFEGVEDREIEEGYMISDWYVLQYVKAYDNDVDITDKIKVNISEPVDNKYVVTYTVEDEFGHKEESTAVYTAKTVDY